jgi:hypothetical protein
VAAALSSEAERSGTKLRPLGVPVYSVTYAAPDSGRPTGPTYWLAAPSIEFTIDSSQRSVRNLFLRATAGVRPFAPTGHQHNHWKWLTAGGGAAAVLLASTLVLFRQIRRASP